MSTNAPCDEAERHQCGPDLTHSNGGRRVCGNALAGKKHLGSDECDAANAQRRESGESQKVLAARALAHY
jgi:hypothetical protein